MKTIITDLLTQEKTMFVNDLSLEENIVNAIICKNKQVGNLLNPAIRDRVKLENPSVSSISTKTGKPFAYCENQNLHAQFN